MLKLVLHCGRVVFESDVSGDCAMIRHLQFRTREHPKPFPTGLSLTVLSQNINKNNLPLKKRGHGQTNAGVSRAWHLETINRCALKAGKPFD